MQLGVVFPQTEIGADPGGVRAYAQAAQDLGFRHLLAYDHVLGADPSQRPGWRGYTHESMFHEVFVLFGYLAAAAPQLELAPCVVILPQRQTALVAKQAAEVDVLTGGKFRLGVGLGWNAVEFEALGMDFHNRGRRVEEQIDLLRRLWTEPVLSYAGRDHSVTQAGLNPMPLQQPIPIWIGGFAEPAFRRAARIADGFFPLRPLEGGWSVTLDKLRTWVREAGRDPETFGIDVHLRAHQLDPVDWGRSMEEWRAFGVTHVSVTTMGGELAGPDAHIERLRLVSDMLQMSVAAPGH
jgi:probable F420-dependent oxidoreductase